MNQATATFQYEVDPSNPKIIYVPFDNSEYTWMPDRIQITLYDDPPAKLETPIKVEEPLLLSEEVWQIVKQYYSDLAKPIPKKVRDDCLAEIAREKELRANPPPPSEEILYIPAPSMEERPEYGTPEFWRWYSKNKAFFQAKKKAAAEAKAAKEAAKAEKEAKRKEALQAKIERMEAKEAKRLAKEAKAEKQLAKKMEKLSIK